MRKAVFLVLVMMAGCGRQVRDIKFPDAAAIGAWQSDAMGQVEQNEGTPDMVPNQILAPNPYGAGHADSNAEEMKKEPPDSGEAIDFGVAETDAGASSMDASSIDAQLEDSAAHDAEEVPDTADARSGQNSGNAPDAASTVGVASNELWANTHGLLVIAELQARASIAPMPWWSRQAAVSGIFRAAGGRQYLLLVYERRPGEQLSSWMARAEAGDSSLSSRRLRTANQMTGFVYETGDYGESPFVHVTVASAMYVYVFYTDDQTMEVPLDFVQFVEGVSVL